MSILQDTVLAAIKAGNNNTQEIISETKLNKGSVSNAIRRLRKWGEIESDGKGTYTLPKKEDLKNG